MFLVDYLHAGDNAVKVHIGGKGDASGSATVEGGKQVSSMTPSTGNSRVVSIVKVEKTLLLFLMQKSDIHISVCIIIIILFYPYIL